MIDRNDGEGNCLNQIAGILEEYASPEFARMASQTPTEALNLGQQWSCFYDFYEAVLSNAAKAHLDASSLREFSALLDAVMEERDAVAKSESRDLSFVRTAQWNELQVAAARTLDVVRTFPKYSREWCDAMRANRLDPATVMPAREFQLPDGFFDDP